MRVQLVHRYSWARRWTKESQRKIFNITGLPKFYRNWSRSEMVQRQWSRYGKKSLIAKQIRIGQCAFIGGLWPKKWLALQQQYFTQTRSNKSPKFWKAKTIAHTQNLSFEMLLTRNAALRKYEDSTVNRTLHTALNTEIDDIYNSKPSDHFCSETKKESVQYSMILNLYVHTWMAYINTWKLWGRSTATRWCNVKAARCGPQMETWQMYVCCNGLVIWQPLANAQSFTGTTYRADRGKR